MCTFLNQLDTDRPVQTDVRANVGVVPRAPNHSLIRRAVPNAPALLRGEVSIHMLPLPISFKPKNVVVNNVPQGKPTLSASVPLLPRQSLILEILGPSA